MSTTRFLMACVALVAASAGALQAQPSGLPFVLPESFETKAALSAAPEALRDGAGVYVLGREGYHQTRKSTNGYNCLVERNPEKTRDAATRQSFAPQCYDEPSSQSRLMMLVEQSRLIRAEGLSGDEAQTRLAEAAQFKPDAPGIVYMASALNTLRDPTNPTGPFAAYPPHVMFLAPNRSDASVSGGIVQTPGGMLTGWPFLPGPPRDTGLIIVPLDRILQDRIIAEQADLVADLSRYVPVRRLHLQ